MHARAYMRHGNIQLDYRYKRRHLLVKKHYKPRHQRIKMSWIPVEEYLGELPTDPSIETPLPIPDDFARASEILVCSFITIHGIQDQFTGFYKIFTKDLSGKEYIMYLNAPYLSGTIANSENFWLPYGTNFEKKVYVTLISNGPIRPEKKTRHSIVPKRVEELVHAHTRLRNDEFITGQVFITGMKVHM